MKLVTRKLERKLKENWTDQEGQQPPALKIFSPAGAATWLIHSMDPDDGDRLFGLCDLGLSLPELGYVSLSELSELKVPVKIRINGRTARFHLPLERDLYFRPEHSLRAYDHAAKAKNRITESTEDLNNAAQALHAITEQDTIQALDPGKAPQPSPPPTPKKGKV